MRRPTRRRPPGCSTWGSEHLLSGQPAESTRRSSPGHARTSMSKTAKRRDRRLRDGAPRDPAATPRPGLHARPDLCARRVLRTRRPADRGRHRLVDANTTLVIVDAAAGNARPGSTTTRGRTWRSSPAWIRPLTGSASPRSSSTTSRRTPRHAGATRSARTQARRRRRHLGLEVIGQPLSRGGNALVKVHVH